MAVDTIARGMAGAALNGGGSTSADKVSYDGTTSGLSATNVQGAIDELAVKEVTVTGTDPTITGAENTRYLCGEVLSLSFTPSATGICEVIFTSGSTPTVLTLPNTVKMPGWFTVEANMVYEVNILDGVYGSVMSWGA